MYKAPVDEILFTLKHVAGLGDALASGRFGDLGEDVVDAILTEAGRFATEEVAPLGEPSTLLWPRYRNWPRWSPRWGLAGVAC